MELIKQDLFFELVRQERIRQNKAWPNVEKRKDLSLDRWNTILLEELGEFCQEVLDGNNFKALTELVEVAAVISSMVELSALSDEENMRAVHDFLSERARNQKSKE